MKITGDKKYSGQAMNCYLLAYVKKFQKRQEEDMLTNNKCTFIQIFQKVNASYE